uniref:Plastocyanin-like domain-containing protein n=1 Tax=Cucumis sativus TaxID=3659 RepID=A0A0A0KYZ5_CUCSA
MAGLMFTALLCLSAAAMTVTVRGEDPYFFFTWNVTYGTISPLGVPQQGILINGQFPGPNINSTSNNNLVINVFNNLDEPFLLHCAARPNPQGSYHYGSINITRTIKLVNSVSKVDGKLRYAINGVSHVDPETPLKLAEYFEIADKVFKYDTISDEGLAEGVTTVTVAPNVVNTTFRNFIEIIFENHEKSLQSWHLDGYSFFAVA